MYITFVQVPIGVEKGVRSLETGITNSHETPDVGVGYQTWVLCKKSKYS